MQMRQLNQGSLKKPRNSTRSRIRCMIRTLGDVILSNYYGQPKVKGIPLLKHTNIIIILFPFV
jgi:hypothetical protein